KNRRYLGKILDGFLTEEGEKGGKILRAMNYKPVIVEEGELGEHLHVKIVQAFSTYLMGVRS
ncbi:MAG: hypothetical protein QXG38_04180, partial [Candidatus Hadarchaeales archaeon]